MCSRKCLLQHTVASFSFRAADYTGDGTFWSEKESSPLPVPAPRTAAVGGDARAHAEEPLFLLAVKILRSGIWSQHPDPSIRPRGAAPAISAAI